MKKTSFKQKLFLVIFGILLTAILLEAGLRIAGGIVLYLQERHNHITFNNNEYRILCLGESTTALGGEDSYPSLLEKTLNAQTHGIKFTAINKGVVSTTTQYILEHVEENLDKYKPQLVVVMMGINDKAYLHNPYKNLWWEYLKSDIKDFRVYKLVHLLYEHITHRTMEVPVPTEETGLTSSDDYQLIENSLKAVIIKSMEQLHEHVKNSTQYQRNGQLAQAQQENQFVRESLLETSLLCIELAQRYRLQGDYKEAQDVLKEATMLNPKYPVIYQEWGELYLSQGDSDHALKAFQTALALDPQNSDIYLQIARAYYQGHHDEAFLFYDRYLQINPQNYWGYIEVAKCLRETKHYTQAEEYLIQAIKLSPGIDQAYVDMGQTLDNQSQYPQEEAFYLKEITLQPHNPRLYQILGQFYQKRGREDLAKGYFQKEAEAQMAEYFPVTLVNYNLLLNKILSRHLKVVVMQYPLRDIGPLKDYLGAKKDVVYVENKQNFKEALSKEPYSHYFKDNFAFNFGHCTREGNELIAHHLAAVILKNE